MLACNSKCSRAVIQNVIIALGQIFGGRQAFAGVADHVEVPFAARGGSQSQGQCAPLPVAMEYRLIRLRRDRAKAHHAAEVIGAIHDVALPFAGDSASPTPIMLSRVTSAASCSSLMPSVFSGRMGTTI